MSKLKEMVHYICDQFRDVPEILGSVKLNKICWFSDVDWYFLSRETISGHISYIKQPQGPVLPDIKDALNELGEDNKVSSTLLEFEDYKQWYYQSREESNTNFIPDKQRNIIDFWISYAKENSARVLIGHAHDYPWWEDLNYWDIIPISYGVFINRIIEGSAMSEQQYASEVTNRRSKD